MSPTAVQLPSAVPASATHVAAATPATTKITPRRDTRSEIQPIGHCSNIEPNSGAAKNAASRVSGTSTATAYTAPSPMRIPAEAPLKNVVTMPVGTMLASSRSDMRSGTTSGGLLEAESTTGISEAETRTDARRKSFTPSGSATSSRNCPIVAPPIGRSCISTEAVRGSRSSQGR